MLHNRGRLKSCRCERTVFYVILWATCCMQEIIFGLQVHGSIFHSLQIFSYHVLKLLQRLFLSFISGYAGGWLYTASICNIASVQHEMGLKYCVMLASFCGVQHGLLMSKLDFWMQVCIKAWCSRLGRDHPCIVVQFDFCCLSGNRFHCPWWPICALNLYPACSTKEHCSTLTLNWDAEKWKNWFNAFTNMVLLQATTTTLGCFVCYTTWSPATSPMQHDCRIGTFRAC